jgi:hypothetical protein
MNIEWRELAIYRSFRIKAKFIDGYAMEVECVATDHDPLSEGYGLSGDISSLKLKKEDEVIKEATRVINEFWLQVIGLDTNPV